MPMQTTAELRDFYRTRKPAGNKRAKKLNKARKKQRLANRKR